LLLSLALGTSCAADRVSLSAIGVCPSAAGVTPAGKTHSDPHIGENLVDLMILDS
jgi:hypothetical protein